ncbi:MAG TPA: hypothetical protein VFM53_08170 [Anaeromyxobacteraceae bacterium]|nr:hypothetical protein [Anaeromyxobacteraceae bacterium]
MEELVMEACVNCGWVSDVELMRHGLCLTCSEYRRRNGSDRPPPDDAEHLHRGETWPRASDPRVRELVVLAAAR